MGVAAAATLTHRPCNMVHSAAAVSKTRGRDAVEWRVISCCSASCVRCKLLAVSVQRAGAAL